MFRFKWVLCTCILICPTVVFPAERNFGILQATAGENQVQVCASYVTPAMRLPNSGRDAISERLVDLTALSTCNSDDIDWNHSRLNASVVVLDWTNCSMVETAAIIQSHRGKGLLVVAPSVLMKLPSVVEMKANNVSIPSGVISKSSFKKIKALGENLIVREFIPPDAFYVDYSMVIVWFLVMLSVALGTCWEPCILIPLNEGRTQAYEISDVNDTKFGEQQKSQITGHKEHIPLSTRKDIIVHTNKKESSDLYDAAAANKRLGFSILKMVIVIVLISAVLLLLYFFYDVVVYFVMALFALVSMAGMYWCLCTFKFLIPCSYSFKVLRTREIEIRELFLLLVCIGFVTAWIVLRMESYGWVFQDILAIFAAIRCISKLELYNLQVCIVVLLLFFLYTTFLIFGTPPMTPENQSVMLALASGGLQDDGAFKEHVPMSLRIPSLTLDPLDLCIHRDTVIGIIDIVIPGAVVAYCFNFGRKIGLVPCVVYFIGALSAQGTGLILTFVATYYLKHGQPALLYIAPCVLIVIVLISLARKEFKSFWVGIPKVNSAKTAYDPVSQFESKW